MYTLMVSISSVQCRLLTSCPFAFHLLPSQVGDRVMTGEPCCFANRLNAPAQRVVKLDDRVPFEDAASLQSVYNTSHHSLINLARIRKGESVLIHSAAGGIGHAGKSIYSFA